MSANVTLPLAVGDLIPGELDAPFWEAWRKDETFLLHRCEVCGRHDWPASCCATHGRKPMQWVPVAGTGIIDTYTVFHRAYIKELASEVPYVVAVVRLDEGPYFHTRIVGIAPAEVKTGLRVRVRKNHQDKFPLFLPES